MEDMPRIDICETIRLIDFPVEAWEWLDLFGNVVGITQREAMYQERTFLADTPFKKILLCAINKDLSTLNTIYILLRCELIHQASSHVRLLCESLISLKYISLESESRSALFWGYADIEAYDIASSLLEWEGSTANLKHVEGVKALRESISGKYKSAKGTYSFVDKKGREKPFSNWCNKSVFVQARDCGPSFQRLYELVYRQMSSYIHGTAWSLRRQVSYSRDHYLPDVILNDIAAIVRTASAVWMEWANFCMDILNWRLSDTIMELPAMIEEMEERHFTGKNL
ncbi:hypothetical protein KP003_00365 [Geomonas nitrogeniifigens]|uniref:DUF5677 domain-containing protein n=1 Tax=Geomonas diazotrophica TaxID=2843197 RepID=UPI001C2C13B5|nr:DUF5677 domain-containing protein [Geomonas nitrogeniifigens]QXE86897.1 hypothetical protein KP003_00365 [Geomonas nitrogeniifigens]